MRVRGVRTLPVDRLRQAGVAIGAWGAIAALFLVQRLLGLAVHGKDPVWDRLGLELAVTWGGWALVTPIIFRAVRRLPLRSENPLRALLHVPIGVGVALIHSLIVATITPLFIWRPSLLPIRDMFTGRLASTIASETLIYFMVAAAYYTWIYASEADQRPATAAGVPEPVQVSLAVPTRDGVIQIPVASLDWLQSEDNYVRLHVGARSHLLRATLSSLEQRLVAAGFVRIHRSTMVRAATITALKRTGADRYAVILSNGLQLRVSRQHRKDVASAIGATPATG